MSVYVTETGIIDNKYKYHAPKEGQSELYEEVRATAKVLASLINSLGNNMELSLAQTNLEQAVFWTNAGIARGGIVEKKSWANKGEGLDVQNIIENNRRFAQGGD